MGAIASQITSLTIVYPTVYSDADHRKYQSSASLAIVPWIHRGPVNSPHKWPVTRKMVPWIHVIMDHVCRIRWVKQRVVIITWAITFVAFQHWFEWSVNGKLNTLIWIVKSSYFSPKNCWCDSDALNIPHAIGFRRKLWSLCCLQQHHIPLIQHDDVIKWKHFPRSWTFVRGVHRWPVDSTHKGQWRGPLMLSLICAWTNGWANNRYGGDLRRHRAHYDVTVMSTHTGYTSIVVSYHEIWFISFYARIYYSDVIMSAMASQITSISTVYSAVCSEAHQENMKAPRYWPLWY